MLRALILVVAVAFALPALADPYPEYRSTTVNDFADLLEPDYEATLVEVLEKLKADTGVEMVVVTINTRFAYDPAPNYQAFATGLFNHWGIGDADRNDGIMVLVARDDREMRIELGSGYGRGFNAIAGGIIDDSFLPNFRQDNYRRGILRGVDEIVLRIALPFSSGDEAVPEGDAGNGNLAYIIIGAFAAFITALLMKSRIGDLLIRFKACPTCGRRGLHRGRQITKKQVKKEEGAGVEETACSHCDYRESRSFVIRPPSRPSKSGRSFGGGRSSGGGASGRW